eukprot:s3203_g9.t1
MRRFSGSLLRQGGVYRLWPSVRFEATVSLQCAGKTNAGKLAGAISQRIRSENLVQIEMIGPEAVYTAIKSVIIAGEYAKQEIEDKVLAVRQELVQLKDRVAPSGRTTDSTALRMHVAAVEKFKEIDHETTYISGDTNPGVAAGLLCRLVETKGMAPVACMGTAATSKTLKAFMITEDYLRRNETLGDNVLAFQVQKDWFKERGEDHPLRRQR